MTSFWCAREEDEKFFRAPPPGRLVQPLERSKRLAFFDMVMISGFNSAHIVGSVSHFLLNSDRKSEMA